MSQGVEIRKALGRLFLLAVPLLSVVAIYVICDPFKVLWSHHFGNYYDQAAPVELNRDYASLQIFLKNNPEQKYNSFILGSSRSFPLHVDTWQKLIPGARPFHYPAASESLYGILLKLRYLNANKIPLKHVILEISVNLVDGSVRTSYTHILPHLLTGESWLEFQYRFFRSYFRALFFLKYSVFVLTGGHVNLASQDALAYRPGSVRIDPITNDYFFEAQERDLAENEDTFYAKRSQFFQRVTGCFRQVMGPVEKQYLEEIRDIFRQNGTDYRIWLPPTYDQICINPNDIALLRDVFGPDKVFNFAGINEWTESRQNFYDPTHVRPFIGDKMIEEMYRGR